MLYKIQDLQTEQSIRDIKNFFLAGLKVRLNLHEIYAPLYVRADTGINDNLNGVEQPVSFHTRSGGNYEIVHSLAKWKRRRLRELNIPLQEGIVTNMTALRPDEIATPLHSILVDQWDWEMHIAEHDRTLDYLKRVVAEIYGQAKATEQEVARREMMQPILPPSVTFIHTEDLSAQYPDKTPKEREDLITERYGAVFLMGIGNKLNGGEPHDGRAPDYDDWSTQTSEGHFGLNGDLLFWHPSLRRAFEISSMGIRVDATALEKQLAITNTTERKTRAFHKDILDGKLPFSIGGGIGQSRLCMFMLRKQHIGEVQYCDD